MNQWTGTLTLPKSASDERVRQVTIATAKLLAALGIEQTEATQNTPQRMARMYVEEVFAGLYEERPEMTTFTEAGVDALYTVGPLSVRSTCAHHFAPILGRAWVGVLPDGKLLGLSKFARLSRWVMARPHTQETATQMLANELQAATGAKGIGVVVQATHLCMTWRGVKEHDATMVTSVVLGTLLDTPSARAEFFALVAAQGFGK